MPDGTVTLAAPSAVLGAAAPLRSTACGRHCAAEVPAGADATAEGTRPSRAAGQLTARGDRSAEEGVDGVVASRRSSLVSKIRPLTRRSAQA